MTRPSPLVLALTLGFTTLAMPLTAAYADNPVPALQELHSVEKMLHFRHTPPAVTHFHVATAGSTPTHSPLQVDLSTEKSYYRVGEKIKFKVRGNRDFYLYLFDRDANSNKWLSILPNRYQTNRQIKYVGDYKPNLVPNRGLEFFADHPGTERITMVASERYLDVDTMQRISQAKSIGSYFEWNDPVESFRVAINDSYQDQLGHEKSLQIRPSATSGQVALHTDAAPLPGLVTKEFLLTIN